MSRKTADNLHIGYLLIQFNVATEGTIKFDKALEDGTIDNMIKECADTMYGGDATEVVKQLIKNCQDKDCRFKSNPPCNTFKANERTMVEHYEAYLQDYRVKHCANAKPAKAHNGKAHHELTVEEINSIEDPKIAENVYNGISSYLKNHFSATDVESLTAEQIALRDELRAKRAVALKRKHALLDNATAISSKLINKLGKNGKTTLSASEVDELRKLLGI